MSAPYGGPWGSDPVWGGSTPWGGPAPFSPGGSSLFPPQAAVQINPTANVSLAADADIVCIADIDPYFSLQTGPNCLAQDLIHGITTPSGGLFYDGSWGFDIRQQLSGPVTARVLNQISAQLQWQWGLDARVQNSSAVLQWDGISTLTITGVVVPVSGAPFQFVLNATTVTVQLLQVV